MPTGVKYTVKTPSKELWHGGSVSGHADNEWLWASCLSHISMTRFT